MKTLAKIIFIAAGVAVAIPVTNAADPGAATAAARHPRLRALLVRKAVRQRIAHRLGLSSDQATQLKAARTKTVAEVKIIRADTSLSGDQKKAKIRETIQAARAELRSVLTADQQAKLDKLRAHLRARRHGSV
jgi:hypothetical protein